MNEIWSCLLRPQSGGKRRILSLPQRQQNSASKFQTRIVSIKCAINLAHIVNTPCCRLKLDSFKQIKQRKLSKIARS